jgi:putative transposase
MVVIPPLGQEERVPERLWHDSTRRFDAPMGTMYLKVPKFRKCGYIPFFVNEKKHAEQGNLQLLIVSPYFT